MNTLIARYEDIDAARQTILELSAKGFERRHIYKTSTGRAKATAVQVTTAEERLEEVSDILKRHRPRDVEEKRPN